MAKTQMYRNDVLSNTQVNLYPVTEAKYVTMNDGQTVEEMMSNLDTDKYTPVIESSKAMFKVGEGDSVDLSESAIDGAYNSCVLKGKTMVNCIQEPSSQDVVLPYEFADGQYVTINDTKESGALGVELKGQTLVNLAENSTAYAVGSGSGDNRKVTKNGKSTKVEIVGEEVSCVVVFDSNYQLKANTKYTITFDSITTGFENTMAIGFHSNEGSYAISTRVITTNNGKNKIVLSTPSEFEIVGVTVGSHGIIPIGSTIQISNMIVLEGDYTNIDIPYFEGMTSCKMPILSTAGKNLFDGIIEKGNINISNGEIIDGNTSYRSVNYTKIKMNTIYFIQTNQNTPIGIRLYDVNKNFISSNSLGANSYFNSGNAHFVKFVFVTTLNLENIQLEESSTATSYESYKTSILSTPSDLELCGIGDVCDTLDLSSGELSQRIGEVVLDGSETDISMRAETLENTLLFRKHLSDVEISSTTIYSDKFDGTPISWNEIITSDKEFIRLYTNDNNALYIRILKSKLETEDVDGFRNWLTKNPLAIKYQRLNVVNKAVDLKVVDQNGSVIPTLKSWNTTTHIYSEIPENSLYPILSHSNPTYPVILKPSTKYSIIANSYSNDHTNSAINFNLGGATASTTVGSRVTTITTPSTLSNELFTMSGRGNKLKNVMVIEGDVAGDEPYFEGICDCKSPILSNVGKNLVNPNNYINYPDNNISVKKDGEYSYILENKTTGNWRYQIGDKVKLKANTTYTLSYDYELLSESVPMNYGAVINLRDESNHNKNISGDAAKGKPRTFTTTEDVTVRLAMYITDTSGGINKIKYYNIQVVEAPTVLDYEPYKSNTTTFEQKDDKTIVLRSLPSGVCDTLNVETGEYVQRIGEVTKNNSTGFSLSTGGWENKSNVCTFEYFNPEGMKVQNANNKPTLNCDKVPSNTFADQWGNTEGIESITQHSIGGIVLSITRDKLLTQDVDGLNTYLQSNPLTIQYELETPIVSTIDVQGFPYAYKDGHVQLSSGSIEQSLTPKVEYSLVANKSGQIDNNTKMTIRHDKQINEFENVMLVSLLESSYQKTLMKFNFDMQMMNVGGEEQCQN